MNFLTGNYAVSLFPRTTFVDSATITCQDLKKNAAVREAWMNKYRNRGFEVLVAENRLPSTGELQEWARAVGDRWCWVMPYKWKGMRSLDSLPVSPI